MTEQKSKPCGGSVGRQRLVILFLVLLVIATSALRFCNLDGKVLARDEVDTRLNLSGYADTEVWKTFLANQPVSVQAFEKFQVIHSEKTFRDTLNVLIVSRQENLSIYFLLLRTWAGWFGASVTSVRCFSALLSLLALPCAWWCAFELFRSRLAANIFAILVVVSPFHLLYAQEARPYSLWTATILLSSACLLRAIRCETKASWLGYSAALTLCCYTHVLGVSVAVAHCLYVLCLARMSGGHLLKPFAVAILIAIAAYMPVPFLFVTHANEVLLRVSNFAYPMPIQEWISGICLSATQIFVDLNNVGLAERSAVWFRMQSIIVASLLCLEAYSWNCLIRNNKASIWLFIVILSAVDFLPFAGTDLIFGGARCLNVRYLIPLLLGLEFSVAHMFYTKWRSSWAWRAGAALLIVAGLVSSANAAFANDWWNKPQDDLRMRQVAKYINQYDKAAVIFIQANSDVATTLGICNLLRRDAHVCTCNQELPWNFPTGYKHVFAYIADNHYERSEEYLLSRPGPKPKSVFQHILFRYDNAEP